MRNADPPHDYLALGDSYTIGEGVPPAACWPAQLAAGLRAAGLAIKEPQIVAQTGWTASDLLAAVQSHELTGPYRLVSLQIGVNDHYQQLSIGEYALVLDQLLAVTIDLTSDSPDRVLVVSIPDWTVTPFAAGRPRARLSLKIDRFNRLIEQRTQRLQVNYVDITPLSRRAADKPTLLASDGLHPSRLMYRQWVEQIYPYARAALSPARLTP